MGFWELLEVASMPVLQIMLVGLVGAFLASGYSNSFDPAARKHMNKVVYLVFTPSLMFASLAKTVTLQDIISWWFMPVNIGLTFLIGGTLGWIAVKLLRPERHLGGLIIATCSAGNLGNLMIMVIPAICNEERSPFGESGICHTRGLSYASFSMALGGFFIWTHTYNLMKNSGALYGQMRAAADSVARAPNKDVDANGWPHHKAGGEGTDQEDLESPLLPSTNPVNEGAAPEYIAQSFSRGEVKGKSGFLEKARESMVQLVEELMSPPTIAATLGFIFGATPWLKSLIIGATAPLRVIQDSMKLMGDGTIPCITLVLGGNLTQGIRQSRLKLLVILVVVCLRYVVLPVTGIAVVKAAAKLGLLPADPLFQYALLMQYTLPPAMNIGTMAELFDVAREECSVLFLWTYLVAAFALTIWSTVFMWLLS